MMFPSALWLALLLAATTIAGSAGAAAGDSSDPEDSVQANTPATEENPCAGMAEADFLGIDACSECHEDQVTGMRTDVHGQAADPRAPFAREQCETCHGPGSAHLDVEGNCILSQQGRFGESAAARNEICLSCHQHDMLHWRGSSHENDDLACSSCHNIHGEDTVLERTTQAEVCFQCHRDIRAQTYRASTHPVRAGKVICSDCHDAHGSAGPGALRKNGINDTCYTCHAEKRGPFLWEHYPVTEDCTLCHTPHGSSHEPLLNRQGPQLCQQCHADIRAQGSRHVRRFLDFDDSDPNRGRFIVGENCMNCHSRVHGSNHPSGANLLR